MKTSSLVSNKVIVIWLAILTAVATVLLAITVQSIAKNSQAYLLRYTEPVRTYDTYTYDTYRTTDFYNTYDYYSMGGQPN